MDKQNTGFAAEFIVVAELARRDYNVAVTFGNTKKIDILIEKNGISKQIQVKGLKHRKDYNFRLKVDSLSENCWYVFVNVNRLNLELNYEFAIMNYNEVVENLRRGRNQNDNGIKVSVLDNPTYRNNWSRFEEV
jgi:hypothetical protein